MPALYNRLSCCVKATCKRIGPNLVTINCDPSKFETFDGHQIAMTEIMISAF